MSDKFSLKWNDYQSNWNEALKNLRGDTDFADVTLISDDKVKFFAHKILLSSCSNLFKLILKSNNQANPLLYLGGVNSINLGFILDYIYHGEVNLYQEQLDSFLESAQKLEIQGLMGDKEDSRDSMNERQPMHTKTEPDIEEGISCVQTEEEDKSVANIGHVGKQMRRQNSRSSSTDMSYQLFEPDYPFLQKWCNIDRDDSALIHT